MIGKHQIIDLKLKRAVDFSDYTCYNIINTFPLKSCIYIILGNKNLIILLFFFGFDPISTSKNGIFN